METTKVNGVINGVSKNIINYKDANGNDRKFTNIKLLINNRYYFVKSIELRTALTNKIGNEKVSEIFNLLSENLSDVFNGCQISIDINKYEAGELAPYNEDVILTNDFIENVISFNSVSELTKLYIILSICQSTNLTNKAKEIQAKIDKIHLDQIKDIESIFEMEAADTEEAEETAEE